MRYYSLVFLLFLLLSKLQLFSTNTYFKIFGVVVDKNIQKPLPYVNISIKDKNIGVITNEQGEFIFNIPDEYKNQTIVFSYIGYQSYSIPISSVDYRYKVKVELIEDNIALSEVVIKPINPKKIISEAISLIPINYPNAPTYLNAYYRELVKIDSTYVKFTDAACKIYYSGYTGVQNKELANKKFYQPDYRMILNGDMPFPQVKHTIPFYGDQVEIVESRKSDNFERFNNRLEIEENLKKSYIGGGPLHILSADIVKLNTDILDSLTWNNYKFTFDGIFKFSGKNAYKISFSPIGNDRNAIWKGMVYIDSTSMAFISFNFYIPQDYLKYIRDKNIEHSVELKKRKAKKNNTEQIVNRTIENNGQTIMVHYQNIDEKWYLSYIQIENSYCNYGDLFDTINYKTYVDIMVNYLSFNNVTSLSEEKTFLCNKYNYLYLYDTNYDVKFWENYNIQCPSQIFKDALIDLSKDKSLNEQFHDNSLYNKTKH